MTAPTPDYLESFIGFKGLHASPDGRLFSPQRNTLWPAGARLEAECFNKSHVPPEKGCGCGIYAVKTFEDLKHHGYNWTVEWEDEELGGTCIMVIAEIALYGDVIPGAIGFKARYAAPQTIWVPPHRISYGRAIAARYGTDLGYMNRQTGERL